MTADALGTAKGCSWLASGSPVALLGDIRSYEARCFFFFFFSDVRALFNFGLPTLRE
jgi:hypothetical protein